MLIHDPLKSTVVYLSYVPNFKNYIWVYSGNKDILMIFNDDLILHSTFI